MDAALRGDGRDRRDHDDAEHRGERGDDRVERVGRDRHRELRFRVRDDVAQAQQHGTGGVGGRLSDGRERRGGRGDPDPRAEVSRRADRALLPGLLELARGGLLGAFSGGVAHGYLTPRIVWTASSVRASTIPGSAETTTPAKTMVSRILSGKPSAWAG